MTNQPKTRPQDPGPEEGSSGSGIALGVLGAICFLSWLSASANREALTGGALTAAGLLMLWKPVRQQMPEGCWIAAGIWVLGSLLAFLPADQSMWPTWRFTLAAAGVDTGGHFTPQPLAALASFAVMSATGLVALWAACQRKGNSRWPGIGFVTGVVVYALLAWRAPELLNFKSNAYDTFGFFPNRNHTATLLVMGSMVSLGLLVQAVRWRSPWQIGVAGLALIFLLGILFSLSISRAGIFLLVSGAVFWIAVAGPRYLRGHVGKAVALIVGGAALIFSLLETPVRQRVEAALEKVALTSEGAASKPLIERLENLDARVAIHRDTVAMISEAPLSGWGAGQFQFIFPQYQQQSANLSANLCLHPESDWLWMAAECGVPAMLALVGLGAALVIPTLRSIRKGRARALRAGLLVAALMLPLHGMLDVPGHKFSLLWTAAGLLALANAARPPARWPRASVTAWRLGGFAVAALGAGILHGSAIGKPLLADDRSELLYAKAVEAYRKEQHTPLPEAIISVEAAEDPLENAIDLLNEAASLTPLDPRVVGLRGMLALHFDDQDDLARHSFKVQRVLEPKRISLALTQADSWSRINVLETRDLWIETMRRANAMASSFPDIPWETIAFEQILQRARHSDELIKAATEAAGGDPSRFLKSGHTPTGKDAKHAR